MADTMDVMRLMVIETVKDQLRLEVYNHWSGGIAIRLKLGDENVGDPIVLDVETYSDHRHNVDHITSVKLTGE